MEAHLNHVSRVAEASRYEVSLSGCGNGGGSPDQIIPHDQEPISESLEKKVRNACSSMAGISNVFSSQEKKSSQLKSASLSIPSCPTFVAAPQRGLYKHKPTRVKAPIEAIKGMKKVVRRRNKSKIKPLSHSFLQVIKPKKQLKSPIVGEKRKSYSPQLQGDSPSKKLVISVRCHCSVLYNNSVVGKSSDCQLYDRCLAFMCSSQGMTNVPSSIQICARK